MTFDFADYALTLYLGVIGESFGELELLELGIVYEGWPQSFFHCEKCLECHMPWMMCNDYGEIEGYGYAGVDEPELFDESAS